MRILNKIAIAAAVVVLFAAVQPGLAGCTGIAVIGTSSSAASFSGIWNPGIFTPGYYLGNVPFNATSPPTRSSSEHSTTTCTWICPTAPDW